MEIHINAESKCRKSDVLLKILSKEQYGSLSIPERTIYFGILLFKKNGEWVIAYVDFDSYNASDIVENYCDGLRGIYISDKIMREVVMCGKFPVGMFDEYKNGYTKDEVRWSYIKKMDEEMGKIVDLVSTMV